LKDTLLDFFKSDPGARLQDFRWRGRLLKCGVVVSWIGTKSADCAAVF